MALKITKNNYYVKLDINGNFKIYKTAKERASEKMAPNFNDVCSKYSLIIQNFWRDSERFYYDPTLPDLIKAWTAEAVRYQQCYIEGRSSKAKFPLMAQYINNIEKSLPEIISIGQVRVEGETLEEVYNYVKQHGYFNDVEDC